MHASYEDAFHSVFGGNETGQTLGAFVLLLVPVVEFEAVFDGGVDADVGPFVLGVSLLAFQAFFVLEAELAVGDGAVLLTFFDC